MRAFPTSRKPRSGGKKMFCPYCGKTILDDCEFCTACGRKLNIPQQPPEAAASDTTDQTEVTPGSVTKNAPADPMDVTPPPFPGDQPTGAPADSTAFPGAQCNSPTGAGIPTETPGQPDGSAVLKPIKKHRKPIALFIVLGVLVLGIAAFFITLQTGILFRYGGVRLIYNVTHLCIQHHYQAADCENPELCVICGKERGEPVGHQWTEATCTTGKTCTVCGKTDGEPLGHSTRLGKCSRCGETIKELEGTLNAISNLYLKGSDYATTGCEYTFSQDNDSIWDYYYDCVFAVSYFDLAKDKFIEAANKCGDYPELSQAKDYLKRMAKALPVEYPNSTFSSIKSFIEDAGSYVQIAYDFSSHLLDLYKSIDVNPSN